MGRSRKVTVTEPDPDEVAVGIYLVQCDGCNRWEMYENFGLTDPFDAIKTKSMKLTCAVCPITKRLELAELEICKLQYKIADLSKTNEKVEASWADIVQGPIALKCNQEKAAQEIADLRKEVTVITASNSTNTHSSLSAPQLRQATDEVAEIER